jgi:hypothetical protein
VFAQAQREDSDYRHCYHESHDSQSHGRGDRSARAGGARAGAQLLVLVWPESL